MATLDPGVHDMSEAPFWQFGADGLMPVIHKQWMGEAAEWFAEHMSKLNWGGEFTVEISYMTDDGMAGYYNVTFEKHPFPSLLVVRRGQQVELENDG